MPLLFILYPVKVKILFTTTIVVQVGKCGGLTGGATMMTTTGAMRSLRARLGAFKKF